VPEISVIIPFRNRLEWTAVAVRSVLEQTFEDHEVILVDDGSTGDSRTRIDLTDPRVRYIRQENRGRAAARNRGIAEAHGSFIAFLDSDDLFLPSKLEKQFQAMQDHPSALMSHTSYQRIDADGKVIEDVASGRFAGRVYPEIILSCPIATPTVMVRREAFGFPEARFEEALSFGEDIILWMRLARRTEILGLTEPLTQVRIHGRNADLDEDVQIASRKNTITLMLGRDSGLPLATRQKLRSWIYFDLGYQNFRKLRRIQSAGWFLRSLLSWPINAGVLKDLCILSWKVLLYHLPAGLRGSQGSDEQALRDRTEEDQ